MTELDETAAEPAIRASDADRDRIVGELQRAYVDGRLTIAEVEQRTADAYQARTWPELERLTEDLPTGSVVPVRREAKGIEAVPWFDPRLLCLLLCVCPPAGIGYLLACRYYASSLDDEEAATGAG